MHVRGAGLMLGLALVATARAEPPKDIEAVLAHPIYPQLYLCSEHYAGQFDYLGDALGTDCMVADLDDIDGRYFMRTYLRDGARNEDWYGWNTPVLSPCDCTVAKIRINPAVNVPGNMGDKPSSSVELLRADGVHFLLAHIQAPAVQVGDQVAAGQALAKVGNNGFARNPHVHVAAWRGDTPLQIRWDQRTMGHL